jgi:uncharacterized membrane protein
MFTLYNALEFLHVCAVIVWVGGVITLVVVNARLAREREAAALQALSSQGEFLGKALIGPAALVTLLAGGTLVWEMGIGMPAWVVWGLLGFFGSMAIGAGLMQRSGRKLAELAASGQPDPARMASLRRRMSTLGMLNILVLVSTVWAMVFKPTL